MHRVRTEDAGATARRQVARAALRSVVHRAVVIAVTELPPSAEQTVTAPARQHLAVGLALLEVSALASMLGVVSTGSS